MHHAVSTTRCLDPNAEHAVKALLDLGANPTLRNKVTNKNHYKILRQNITSTQLNVDSS